MFKLSVNSSSILEIGIVNQFFSLPKIIERGKDVQWPRDNDNVM